MMKWHKTTEELPMPDTLCLCKCITDEYKHKQSPAYGVLLYVGTFGTDWIDPQTGGQISANELEYWLAITEIEGNITHEME